MTVAQIFAANPPPLTWWRMAVRAVVALVYGVVVVRLFGRRIFARWSALDIVIAVTMGSTLSRAITGPIGFWPAIAATTIMLLIHRAFAIASALSPRVARLVEGRAIVLAEHGSLRRYTVQLRGVSLGDIEEALRKHGIERLDQAERVMLEPSGVISVEKR